MEFWAKKTEWRKASVNTSVCLLGCAIGDFGVLIICALYFPETPLMQQMVMAITAGITTSIILETIIMKFKEKFPWKDALKVALSMSLISMITMELAMNIFDMTLVRTYNLTPTNIYYWLLFIPTLGVGFISALPYNYWRLVKFGKSCCAKKEEL